jgi:HEAT repeat protein
MNRIIVTLLGPFVLALVIGPVNAACPRSAAGREQRARIERLIRALAGLDTQARINAANELEDLGPAAKDAIIPLIDALQDQDKDVRRIGANALGAIGPKAIPQLIKCLSSENSLVRYGAVAALYNGEATSDDAIEPMIALLKDPDPLIRCRVIDYMTVHRNKAFVKHLVQVMIFDKDKDVRRWVVGAFANYGKDAPEAIPGLISLISDPTDLGETARGSLVYVGSAAVPALAAILENGEADDKTAAMDVLIGIGPAAAKAVPRLRLCLSDRSAEVRELAARTLGYIGPEAKAVLPDLFQSMKGASIGYQLTLVHAIYRIDASQSERIVPIVSGALKHRESGVRVSAAIVLMEMGPDGKDAIANLVEALNDNDVTVRLQVVYALREMAATNASAMEGLKTALNDKERRVRWEASEALEFVKRAKAKEIERKR